MCTADHTFADIRVVVEGPMDFLASHVPTSAIRAQTNHTGSSRRTSFVLGLDQPFNMSCTTAKGKEFKFTTCINVVGTVKRGDKQTIFVRPAGTMLNYQTVGPCTLRYKYTTTLIEPLLPYISKDFIISMAFGRLPGSHDHRPQFGIYVAHTTPTMWLLDTNSAPIEVLLQPEARDILIGRPAKPLDISDLVVVDWLKAGLDYEPLTRSLRKSKSKATKSVESTVTPPDQVCNEWSTVGHPVRKVETKAHWQLYQDVQAAKQASLARS